MDDAVIQIQLTDVQKSGLGTKKARVELHYQFDNSQGSILIPQDCALLLRRKYEDELYGCTSLNELRHLLTDIEMQCAKSCCLRLVEKRDRCRFEMEERLRRDGFSDSCIEEVIAWLEHLRIIDDKHFADVFIRSKMRVGWGKLRIERELREKNIEPSSLLGWPEAYYEQTDELERAYELASARSLPRLKPYEKTVRYLLGRGFNMSVATAAAKRVIESQSLEQNAEF